MDISEAKVLIFKINGEYYAADIMEIERILGYEEPTNLPDAPSFVQGVINYQGKILPVVSLSRKFNLREEEIKNEAKIIVVKEEENKLGIIVDVVPESNTKLDNIEQPPEIVAGISKRYIKGLIKIENKIIIFLNLSTILTEEEKSMI